MKEKCFQNVRQTLCAFEKSLESQVEYISLIELPSIKINETVIFLNIVSLDKQFKKSLGKLLEIVSSKPHCNSV